MTDLRHIRAQFPIFRRHPLLVYLDNAATTQKPAAVIEATTKFYSEENASIHRGLYALAAQVSERYEAVRRKVAAFIGAAQPEFVVFTSGATAGINLVAQSFLAPRLQVGDEVLITQMEHHANLLPWQQACRLAGAKLVVLPLLPDGSLDVSAFKNRLSDRTRMVAIAHISNVLGTINPVEDFIAEAHKKGIPVLVDGAQYVAHYPLDVLELDADFYVFSGHKMFGPTGVGVLYGKPEHLAAMQPAVLGGDMVRNVSFEEATFSPPPHRFEAGTTHIAGVIGLGSAIDFLKELNPIEVAAHLAYLTGIATDELLKINGLALVGVAEAKSAIVSFTVRNIHPHDLATYLGSANIAVRAGRLCAQPLIESLGLSSVTRASFSIYNTPGEIRQLADTVGAAVRFFQ